MGSPSDVVVIGGGQAGLARELTEAGVEHIVLERGRAGQTWRDRWDSFCLVTPNVGAAARPLLRRDDLDGYMLRDEIFAYLESYRPRIRSASP